MSAGTGDFVTWNTIPVDDSIALETLGTLFGVLVAGSTVITTGGASNT